MTELILGIAYLFDDCTKLATAGRRSGEYSHGCENAQAGNDWKCGMAVPATCDKQGE